MRWAATTPYQPRYLVPAVYNFDFIEPRESLREVAERFLADLQLEIQALLFIPIQEFRPRIEHIIRDWLMRNSERIRRWTFNLTEQRDEHLNSIWNLDLTLDNETFPIQFTLNR